MRATGGGLRAILLFDKKSDPGIIFVPALDAACYWNLHLANAAWDFGCHSHLGKRLDSAVRGGLRDADSSLDFLNSQALGARKKKLSGIAAKITWQDHQARTKPQPDRYFYRYSH